MRVFRPHQERLLSVSCGGGNGRGSISSSGGLQTIYRVERHLYWQEKTFELVWGEPCSGRLIIENIRWRSSVESGQLRERVLVRRTNKQTESGRRGG